MGKANYLMMIKPQMDRAREREGGGGGESNRVSCVCEGGIQTDRQTETCFEIVVFS